MLGAAIAFAGGLLLYLAGISGIAGADSHGFGVRVAVLAALCVATGFRRSRPIAALVGGLIPVGVDLALGPTLPIWLIYSDLVYAAVRYGSSRAYRVVVASCAVASVAVCAVAYAATGDWRAAAVAVALAFAFLITPIWWALSVRTHAEMAATERDRAGALRAVAERDRRAAVAEERNRMARDLHDVIAGHLSAIAIQSEAAATATDPAVVAEILRSVRENSVGALAEMRTMIGLLSSDTAPADTLAPRRLAQLPGLVESARAAGSEIRVNHDPARLPAAIDHAAYRIVQEALTNAIKHAPNRPIELDIHTRGDRLTVTVRNRAPGAPGRPGQGLLNMRERAERLGGSFSAGPAGPDWQVRAVLPL